MPFIPLDDDTPRLLIRKPWVTWALLAVCLLMFGLESRSAETTIAYFLGLGAIPAVLSGAADLAPEFHLISPYLTLITYMFLHGDSLHLVGNLLFLWVFGDNIEDSMGHWRYLAFFLLCGVIAALIQILSDPLSQRPLIGASGAVSGILGAYLMLHPRAKVLIPVFFYPVQLRAWFLLIGWMAFQFFSLATATGTQQTAIAWYAHIGGFLAGALLIIPFRYKTIPLFGSSDLPSGVTLRDRNRWSGRRKSGPWG